MMQVGCFLKFSLNCFSVKVTETDREFSLSFFASLSKIWGERSTAHITIVRYIIRESNLSVTSSVRIYSTDAPNLMIRCSCPHSFLAIVFCLSVFDQPAELSNILYLRL